MKDFSIFFAALADPTRLRLLHLMREGEICVCHLQSVLQTNQPKISRHLAYLRNADLVEARRDGKWMHYRLKKMSKDLENILTETFMRLEREPQTRQDAARLKKLRC